MREVFAYQNVDLPIEQRVADLVSRMTLAEKVSQMVHEAPAIERLGIPQYNWWNECLHGVGRAGIATVFPQAIGLAATWNTDLIHQMATVTSTEARAKHHAAVREGNRNIYYGLTFWSPNINIFRDPCWGRGQETYGEDPYLTAQLAVAFIKGLQGDHPRYLKVAACAKHYAVHSGPEHERHGFDAVVHGRDLWDTYLPAFQAAVQEAQVESVMGAYNRTNGEACCASPTLLQKILREAWAFDGHVVSDCGAIDDIYRHHRLASSAAEAAALAVKAGCDLNCGCTYEALVEAVETGLIDEATINGAVERLFRTRFRLGMFDPPADNPYTQIPYSQNDGEAHRQVALQAAREAIVLLKNSGNLLPLRKNLNTVAVIGPNADDVEVLLGNYNGRPSDPITPLRGLREKLVNTNLLYHKGCQIIGEDRSGFAEAVKLATAADVTILVLGLSQQVEGEEGQEEGVAEGKSKGDRDGLNLPGVQEELLKAIYATGKPVVLVLLNGSPISLNWASENIPAIVEAWYPGQAGGAAIADVLFGDYNPGGRLPITFYRSLEQVPPFRDYGMAGRTYRYMTEKPLYPFGHGLSYTAFEYRDLRIEPAVVSAGQPLQVSVNVRNTGAAAGDEVVQLYVTDQAASVPVPVRHLEGFRRIHLQPGESQTIGFTLSPRQMAWVDEAGNWVVEPGLFEISIGGGQPGYTSLVATGKFEVTGGRWVVER